MGDAVADLVLLHVYCCRVIGLLLIQAARCCDRRSPRMVGATEAGRRTFRGFGCYRVRSRRLCYPHADTSSVLLLPNEPPAAELCLRDHSTL